VTHMGEMGDVADVLGDVVCVAHIGKMGCETRMVYGMCSSRRIGDNCKCYASGKT
jgi:hypothetical protein